MKRYTIQYIDLDRSNDDDTSKKPKGKNFETTREPTFQDLPKIVINNIL